jgi:hypothetical protein
LSSAILYVAIVAIWACVLIPRWLRRDSSAAPSAEVQADPGVDGDVPAGAEVATGRRSAPGERRDGRDDQGDRRVVSARRRLLLLLVALTVASGVLAGTRLAAWWVIIPPSVMLLGYLVLLRAAGKADAERQQLARTRERARAARTAAAASAAPFPASFSASSSASRPAPAARAEVITFAGSRTSGSRDDQEIYDQYADAKLRAVGD